jgi:hypothetical protein
MSKPSRNWSSADEVLDVWATTTASSRPPVRVRTKPRAAVAWLVPALTGLVVVVVVGALVVGSRPRPPGPTVGPTATASAGARTVECDGGVDRATCDAATALALKTVEPSGWTPTHVWINTGLLCPHTECLFDPNANFPMATPPDGGQWAANAEVAFAATDQHAGMNIAKTQSGLVAVLIGYKVPAPTWCSGTCPSSIAQDGPFKLELVLPHLRWKAGDPITGTAILSYAGSSPSEIWGSGSGPIGFAYREVGGTRAISPATTADCGPHSLASPIVNQLYKSGAPDDEFQQSFLSGGPDVKLPDGVWEVIAIADFTDGSACGGATHHLEAPVRITVGDATAVVATPTVMPTESLAPSPTSSLALAPTPAPSEIPAADPALLAASAWVFVANFESSSDIYFGRLDGRSFKLPVPGYAQAAKPADNGSAVAWWRDDTANRSIVVLLDTATGAVDVLDRSKPAISAVALSADVSTEYWIGAPLEGGGLGLYSAPIPNPLLQLRELTPVTETSLNISVDGRYALLVPPADGNSDCPSATNSRIWDLSQKTFTIVPSGGRSGGDVPFGIIGDGVAIEGWCSSGPGIKEFDIATGAERVIDAQGYGAGLYVREDHQPVIVYSHADGDQRRRLFEYAGSDAAHELLAPAGAARQVIPEATVGLVRDASWGGINAMGWAPLFSGGRICGCTESPLGVTRWLLNLDTGELALAPPLNEPITVSAGP